MEAYFRAKVVLVDLGLADSQMNLWVDWEALVDVESSHTTLLIPYNISIDILKMPIMADTKPAGHLMLLLKADCVCWGSLLCSAAISYP